MSGDPRSRFPAMPPVRFASDIGPWEDPNYFPGTPMRAPAGNSLPMPGNVPTQGSPAKGESVFVADPMDLATIVSGAVSPGIVGSSDPTTTQPFLSAPNTRRNLLMARNVSTGGQNMFLEFGKPASTDTVLMLAPNQIVYIDGRVSQDDLYTACDVAGGRLAYGYSTINQA